jgi:GAF domain-containing protein
MSANPTLLTFPAAASAGGSSVEIAPLTELVTANRQRDALYLLSERLARAKTLEQIHGAALAAIEAALDCDRSSILLFDEDGVMRFVAWNGLSANYRAAVSGHSPWTRDAKDPVPIAIPDIAAADLEPALKETILGEGIRAAAFIPLVAEGALIGKFMAYFRGPHALTGEDLAVALTIARQLGFAIQRARTDAELAAELAATQSLQALSIEIAHEVDLAGLYEKIIDAAVLIMRSEFASMQEFYPLVGPQGELKLLTFRGFTPAAANLWSWVRADSECTCGRAYRAMRRIVVPDVERAEPPIRKKDLDGYAETGIRAVQSTPLFSRTGSLVGMISTHWRERHRPSERDLRLFDILCRIAADLIERKSRDEELRRREERSRTLTQLLTDVPWQARGDGAFEELQPAWENYTGQTWDTHAGYGWLDAIHPDDRSDVQVSWAAACFEARPYERRARIWHARSKEHRLCLIRATPIRNEDGSLREWVGACMEVH